MQSSTQESTICQYSAVLVPITRPFPLCLQAYLFCKYRFQKLRKQQRFSPILSNNVHWKCISTILCGTAWRPLFALSNDGNNKKTKKKGVSCRIHKAFSNYNTMSHLPFCGSSIDYMIDMKQMPLTYHHVESGLESLGSIDVSVSKANCPWANKFEQTQSI